MNFVSIILILLSKPGYSFICKQKNKNAFYTGSPHVFADNTEKLDVDLLMLIWALFFSKLS